MPWLGSALSSGLGRKLAYVVEQVSSLHLHLCLPETLRTSKAIVQGIMHGQQPVHCIVIASTILTAGSMPALLYELLTSFHSNFVDAL